VINSRINNSVSGIARKLRQNKVLVDWEDEEPGSKEYHWLQLSKAPNSQQQVDTYQGYKYLARGDRARKRSLRQANNARRVAVLYETLGIPVFESVDAE